MVPAPIPDDERHRLALLAACKIMYTPAEQAYDDVAQLAADLCGAEIALITLVDSDYQWFKARVGVEQTGTSRDMSFCGHCIVGRQPFVVADTHLDARFADNPLVTGEPFLRSYTGVPLLVDGLAVGSISVADRVPRRLTDKQVAGLQRLAVQISRELRLRRDLGRTTGLSTSMPGGGNDVPLVPGDVVGDRWMIVRKLGHGGTGVVFEARDRDERRVAIKVLLTRWAQNPTLLERFAREARVLMRLASPHVGKLHDVGNLPAERGALPFLALEFLDGTDLEALLEQRGRIDYREAFRWCADACAGLAEAHDLGVVHRDLKPSNIFLATVAEPLAPIVKVLDFGIATDDQPSIDVHLTGAEDILGSPAFMSPEQTMATPVDARTDVWSLGASLHMLVTGQLPFPGNTPFEIFANIQARPPVPLNAYVPDIPDGVQQLVRTCLRKGRDERYPTIRALETELRRLGG